MSSMLAAALLLVQIPSLNGFVPEGRTPLSSKSTLQFHSSGRCKPYHHKCTDRRNFYFRLNANEKSDSEDNDAKENSTNMKSDDELFRDNMSEMVSQDDVFKLSDHDDEEIDPYVQNAKAEFTDEVPGDRIITASSMETALAHGRPLDGTSPINWGGALEALDERIRDIKSGKSADPSYAIFRTISRERPNEAIGRFVREANPEIVSSMSAAVSSLLGSLSNPAMGIEVVVQSSSEKLGQLCFQLMMTGYMFRNAEYVLALKSLMNINADATLKEYKAAFDKLDTNDNGYLEWDEVEAMLTEVYEGKTPTFEVATFMEFFDTNGDGIITWDEFEKGFGGLKRNGTPSSDEYDPEARWSNVGKSLPGSVHDDDDEPSLGEPTVSGTIEVELEDGRVIQVDAQEYIDDLKQQALELKRELAREMGVEQPSDKNTLVADQSKSSVGGIAQYIASLQGDVQSLTKGISPEVVEAMKMLIDFVLEGPASDRGKVTSFEGRKPVEMELPGSALQQLALWQLVIGYRLRETEATGDWRRMME
jgi:hypothetical protein